MLSWLFVTILYTGYSYALNGVIIEQNTISNNIESSCQTQEGITVAAGVYWSIFDTEFFESDSLEVESAAEFYITSSQGQKTILFDSMVNSNIVAILNPSDFPNNQFTVSGSCFQNYGSLFISNASLVDLTGTQWTNTGVMAITGPVVSDLPVVTMECPGLSQLQNLGDVCLTNQYFDMTQQVYGGGCIHLIEGSLLFLQEIDPSDPLDNAIVLDGTDATLGFTPSGATYTVAGYGGGNLILLCNNEMVYEYDDQTGILTLITASHSDYFNIGLGYSTTYFSLEDERTSIYYNGPVPNPPPSHCGVCPSSPTAPGSDQYL